MGVSSESSTPAQGLHTALFLLRTLCLVLAFASWVLASISIRHTETRWSIWFSVDPALIVCGVLASVWFLALTVFAHVRSSIFHLRSVLAICSIFIVWYFALAVSYSARRNSGVYDCFAPGPRHGFPGCRGMMRALMAFCWTEFGLIGLYMISLFFLGKKHSTLPWTNRENPMSVPVGWLCPQQPKTEIIETKP